MNAVYVPHVRIAITDKLVARQSLEGASISFTARFYNDANDTWTAATPSSVRYRLDNPVTGREVIPWTTATPGTSLTITIPGTSNTLEGCGDQAPRELTVEADTGSSQYRGTRRFVVSRSAVEAA